MSESEDDYMSEKFIDNNIKTPGLTFGANKRKHENKKKQIESNKRNKQLPKHELEKEVRNKGLNTAIGNDNKGFALLKKMGYKEGEGLGKSSSGRADPVPITLKIGRRGLGKDEDEKHKKLARQRFHEIVAAKRCKLEQVLHNDFRNRMSNKFSEKIFQADLYKSQKACHQLDLNANFDSPELNFYWPTYKQLKDSDEESSEEEEEECSVGYVHLLCCFHIGFNWLFHTWSIKISVILTRLSC